MPHLFKCGGVWYCCAEFVRITRRRLRARNAWTGNTPQEAYVGYRLFGKMSEHLQVDVGRGLPEKEET